MKKFDHRFGLDKMSQKYKSGHPFHSMRNKKRYKGYFSNLKYAVS